MSETSTLVVEIKHLLSLSRTCVTHIAHCQNEVRMILSKEGERRFGARVHLHPVKKKFRKNPKIPKKNWVVDNLMHEVRSNFQNIWTSVQLSAKKTNRRSVKMCTVHILFWSDLSFLLRAAQKSKCFENWSVPHASNCLPPKKKFGIL